MPSQHLAHTSCVTLTHPSLTLTKAQNQTHMSPSPASLGYCLPLKTDHPQQDPGILGIPQRLLIGVKYAYILILYI